MGKDLKYIAAITSEVAAWLNAKAQRSLAKRAGGIFMSRPFEQAPQGIARKNVIIPTRESDRGLLKIAFSVVSRFGLSRHITMTTVLIVVSICVIREKCGEFVHGVVGRFSLSSQSRICAAHGSAELTRFNFSVHPKLFHTGNGFAQRSLSATGIVAKTASYLFQAVQVCMCTIECTGKTAGVKIGTI